MKNLSLHLRQPWGMAAAALSLILTAAVAAWAQPVRAIDEAETSDPMAPEIPGVTVVERLGETVPLDLKFTGADGRPVTLRDFTADGKPVILSLNYYRCPMLCGLVLDGLADAAKQINLDPGVDYRIVTVSVDPAETASLARMKQESFMRYAAAPYTDADGKRIASKLTAEEVENGWAFLTGEQQPIQALAQSVGFGYQWIESKKEYAHPAVLILLSPDGAITRYLYGVRFEPNTLRLSLVEASNGEIGTTYDRFLLTCHQFDPTAGAYSLEAMFVMRVGGALVVILLLGTIGVMLLREYSRRSGPGPASTEQPTP